MINTGNMVREYVCLEFSKNREDYLLLGTASGDFCTFQMKNKYILICYIIKGSLVII